MRSILPLTRKTPRLGRVALTTPSPIPRLPRQLHTSSASPPENQVFDPIRNPNSLHTYLSLSTASNVPLLTLWSASWCPSCRTVAPLVLSLIRDARVGQDRGHPVNYAPVDFDSPDAHGLATEYIITAIPTLLAFDPRRGEPVARLTDVRSMTDRQFLESWIREQADRSDGGGGGSTPGEGRVAFSGLFGGFSR